MLWRSIYESRALTILIQNCVTKVDIVEISWRARQVKELVYLEFCSRIYVHILQFINIDKGIVCSFTIKIIHC